MLAYAFKVLNEGVYKSVGTEEFRNFADLFSEILILGLNKQIKQGLQRDYIDIDENLSTIRGRIDISESIRTRSLLKNQLHCHFDEFSLNYKLNQIIKTTINILLKADIDDERKIKLKRIMFYFSDVDIIDDIHFIDWNIKYHRNNQNYRMLIYFCELTIKGLLITEEDGKYKVRDFLDDQAFHDLYERFVYEFYKKEFPCLKFKPKNIYWKVDEDPRKMLPKMITDIPLRFKEKTLIIDTKAYTKITRGWGSEKINRDHLFQIFAYVKNEDAKLSDEAKLKGVDANHEVAGMLLYAKTYDGTEVDEEYCMSGNRISVKTLDLNQDFDCIRYELRKIAIDFFGNEILNC